MPLSFTHRRRVPWCETDLTGFLHFSNYVRYMEETEYAFLRSIGLSVVLEIDERGTIGFPRVATDFEVLNPVCFDELMTIELTLARNDGKQICYEFCLDAGNRHVARGQFVVACCRFPRHEPPYAILIPDRVLDLIPLCGE